MSENKEQEPQIKQVVKLRPRAKIRVKTDYDDVKIVARLPRGKRLRIKELWETIVKQQRHT